MKLDLNSLFEMFEQIEEAGLLNERTQGPASSLEPEQKEATIKLPQFRISEQWGTPGTDDRKIIELFTSQIKGSSLKEKLQSISSFVKDCDDRCVATKDVSEILGNLVFLDCLASLVYDFNDKTGGFLFESLLSVLLGGSSRQIPTPGGPNQPIEDLLDSDGKSPMSIKFIFSGPKYIKGSASNLVKGILEYRKPIKYIIALKDRQGKGEKQVVTRIRFFTFDAGIGAGQEFPEQLRKTFGYEEEKTPDYLSGDENFPIKWIYGSGQFQLALNHLKMEHIGTLDLGSRKEIQQVAEKYVARLGDRVTEIYEQLDQFSQNINRYFLSSPEEKSSALRAKTNAQALKQKTEELD